MKRNKIALYSNAVIANSINENDLPNILQEAFQSLDENNNNYNKSLENARKAKEASDKIAALKVNHVFNKGTIEEIKSEFIEMVKVYISSEEINRERDESQKKIVGAIRYLFGLGVYNTAATRSVVRQLELKLNGASKEELSEFAYQEIQTVVMELKAREDMVAKLEKLRGIVRGHDEQIISLEENIELTNNAIKAQDKINKKHGKQFDDFTVTVKKYNSKFTALSNKNKQINEQLGSLVKADVYEKKVKQLESLMKNSKLNNKQLAPLKKKEEEHDKLIDMLIYDFVFLASHYSKKILIAYIIGGLGFLFGLIALLVTVL